MTAGWRCWRTCSPRWPGAFPGGRPGAGGSRKTTSRPGNAPPLDKGQVTCWASWHRWTVLCLLAYIYLTVALERAQDNETSAAAEMIAITVPELARLLHGTVIPPPRQDRPHRLHWSNWRRHQYRARLAHQRWNTYADIVA
jgi:hypothetical protein